MITLSSVLDSCERFMHAQDVRIAKMAIEHSLELAHLRPGETLEIPDFCMRTGVPAQVVKGYYTYVARAIDGTYKLGVNHA